MQILTQRSYVSKHLQENVSGMTTAIFVSMQVLQYVASISLLCLVVTRSYMPFTP